SRNDSSALAEADPPTSYLADRGGIPSATTWRFAARETGRRPGPAAEAREFGLSIGLWRRWMKAGTCTLTRPSTRGGEPDWTFHSVHHDCAADGDVTNKATRPGIRPGRESAGGIRLTRLPVPRDTPRFLSVANMSTAR